MLSVARTLCLAVNNIKNLLKVRRQLNTYFKDYSKRQFTKGNDKDKTEVCQHGRKILYQDMSNCFDVTDMNKGGLSFRRHIVTYMKNGITRKYN